MSGTYTASRGSTLIIKLKRLLVFALMIGIAGLLASCAHHYQPEYSAAPYNFFYGIWHGSIFSLTATVNVISWLCSLVGIDFFRDVEIIGRPNTGFPYYCGFLLGFWWLSLF